MGERIERLRVGVIGVGWHGGGHLANFAANRRAELVAVCDINQESLAQRVGVRRQTILAIEKGHFVPSALLAFRIARELGMRVDELFELRTQEKRNEDRNGHP